MAKIQYFIFIFSKDQKVVQLINTNATTESPTPLLEVILHTNIRAIIKSEFGFYSCFIGKYEEPVSLCKLSLT